MITFLKRHPLLHWPLPKWGLILVLNAFLMGGVGTFLVARFGRSPQTDFLQLMVTALILWLPAVLIFLAGNSGDRCSALDLALPVPAQRLWLTHVAAQFVSAGLLSGASAAMVLLHYHLVSSFGPRFAGPPPPVARMILPLAAALLLAIVLLQSWQLELWRLPRDARYWAQTIVLLLAGYALVVLLSLPRLPVAFIPLVLALALACRAYRAVPPAFVISPRDPGAGDTVPGRTDGVRARWKAVEQPGARTSLARCGFLLKAIYTAASKKRGALVSSYLFLFGWGLLMSAVIVGRVLASGEDLDLYLTTLLVYMLFTLSITPLGRMHLLDALPVPRTHLFAFLVGIPLLAFLLGWGVGSLVTLRGAEVQELVVYQQEDSPRFFPSYRLKYPTVRVPSQFVRIAWDGKVPENSSPWGEAHPAWSMALVRGLPVRVYSPFSTPPEASARFVALQISRAAETVYGRHIPPEEIHERYLADSTAQDPPRGRPVTLRRDYPELVEPSRVSFFPTLMLLAFALWMALTVATLRTCRAGISDAVRRTTFIGLAVLILALHLGFVVGALTGFSRPDTSSAAWRVIVFQVTRALPGGEPALWVLCALAAAAVYRFAETRFERIEFPTPRTAGEI